MFKVSLLPESYRKQLIGKKNKDIILSVALVVLLCMIIVYAGIAMRFLILKTQGKTLQKKNAEIMAKIEELSPYVNDYNALAIAEANFENIKPVDITAMEMVNIIQSTTPDYVEIKALYAPEWQKNQVCVIEGDFPTATTLRNALDMLDNYQKVLSENKDLKDAIKELKVVNDEPIVNEDPVTKVKTYSFRIIISLSGAITIDPSTGTLATTTITETTTAPTTAVSEVATEASTVEPSTIGSDGSKETTTESTTSSTTESSTEGGSTSDE